MDLKLGGKNAIVTGGAGGVGAAICLLLAEEGANLVVSDIALDRAEEVAERCRARGVRAHAVRTDLTVPGDCAGLVDKTVELLRSADVLVNNAGLWPTNLVTEIPLEEWRRTLDVNLTAVFLTSQRFVALNLAGGRKGKILNITSQAAFNGSTTGHAHYAAAKSGVVTFTISLSREVAGKGINVNALALGMVETGMNRDVLAKDREYYEKRIQIGRIARPEEVARFAVFLVSGAADYFTGATYDATGGMLSR
ncbi:MAG TPA: SDR family NAD(P)-dependent oxidoreductase [Anaeromyxobacter sp.]|nr:SDR family NAD(P)-dependent oxidoreductase [Anaeromyxobacter sp.]